MSEREINSDSIHTSKMSDYIVTCMQTGDLRSIRDFLKLLDSVNSYIYHDDENNLNALHLAVGLDSDHRNKIIEMLFNEMNADPNFPARSERVDNVRAIHICSMWGYDTTMKILLLNGADASLRDSNERSPVDYASIFDNYVCISILLRYGSINSSPSDWQSIIDSSLEESANSSFDKFIMSPELSGSQYMKRLSLREISPQSLSSFSQGGATSSSESSIFYYDRTDAACIDLNNNNNNNSPLLQLNTLTTTRRHNSRYSSNYNENDDDDEENNNNDADSSWDRINDADVNYNIDDTILRHELRKYGHIAGPITATTRRLYLKLLYLLKRRQSSSYVPSRARLLADARNALLGYSPELNSILTGKFSSRKALELEREFVRVSNSLEYQGPKQFFNYILIDPRITQNIPERVMEASDSDTSSMNTASQETDPRKVMQRVNRKFNPKLFVRFIKSIFYIGKGQKKRDLMHLYDAVADRDSITKDKIQRIREIWSQGFGVVSLHLFHNITSKEALTREALIIETIGLLNLTNIVKGTTQLKLGWNEHKRRSLGALLLLRAYTQLLNEGERQIRRQDLKALSPSKSREV